MPSRDVNAGTVVIGDRTFDVIALELRGGTLVIEARTYDREPHPEVSGLMATVYGSDGAGVCQGWNFVIPATLGECFVTILLPIQIETMKNQHDPDPAC